MSLTSNNKPTKRPARKSRKIKEETESVSMDVDNKSCEENNTSETDHKNKVKDEMNAPDPFGFGSQNSDVIVVSESNNVQDVKEKKLHRTSKPDEVDEKPMADIDTSSVSESKSAGKIRSKKEQKSKTPSPESSPTHKPENVTPKFKANDESVTDTGKSKDVNVISLDSDSQENEKPGQNKKPRFKILKN